MGDIAEAKTLADRLIAAAPGSPIAILVLLADALARGDFDAGRRRVVDAAGPEANPLLVGLRRRLDRRRPRRLHRGPGPVRRADQQRGAGRLRPVSQGAGAGAGRRLRLGRGDPRRAARTVRCTSAARRWRPRPDPRADRPHGRGGRPARRGAGGRLRRDEPDRPARPPRRRRGGAVQPDHPGAGRRGGGLPHPRRRLNTPRQRPPGADLRPARRCTCGPT